jgi:multiple sugar transport system substrate-binding protein
MKKLVVLLSVLVLMLAAVAVVSTAAPIKVTYWTAPNPTQEVFWRQLAEKFNASQDEINVYVTAIVETPTSEALITSALAAGKAPASSGNIFPGFGATLVNSKALVALDTLPGWDEVVQKRAMGEIIKGWAFADGHVYILPICANAMLFGWRIDILRELGFNEPPTTYSGMMAVGKALKAKYPDKFLIARDALIKTTWWQRWFDFFMLYNAASNGQPFVTGNEVTADDAAVIKVFKFYYDLKANDYLLTQKATSPFETGLSIWRDLGPWSFPGWKANWPKMVLNETFVTAPPPLPDDVNLAYAKTFADAKGLVIYAQNSPEKQAAIWKFIKWVFTDPIHDLAWIDATGMLPMRGDLTTNATFAKVFEDHPELKPYADEMPYAVPAMANEKFAEIQTALGKEGLIPVILGQKTPEQGWADAKAAIEAILSPPPSIAGIWVVNKNVEVEFVQTGRIFTGTVYRIEDGRRTADMEIINGTIYDNNVDIKYNTVPLISTEEENITRTVKAKVDGDWIIGQKRVYDRNLDISDEYFFKAQRKGSTNPRPPWIFYIIGNQAVRLYPNTFLGPLPIDGVRQEDLLGCPDCFIKQWENGLIAKFPCDKHTEITYEDGRITNIVALRDEIRSLQSELLRQQAKIAKIESMLDLYAEVYSQRLRLKSEERSGCQLFI